MFKVLCNLLSQVQVAQILEQAKLENWYDGKVTAPNALDKHNMQANFGEKFVTTALLSNVDFVRYCYPKHILPAITSKYEIGQFYGPHTDSPFIRNIRNDIACTVFLSDPSTYEGGELAINLEDEIVYFKLQAGDAIVYPSHLVHEVCVVDSGVRYAAITFIESLIKDPLRRDLLFTLERNISEIVIPYQKTELTYVLNNLKREWGQ